MVFFSITYKMNFKSQTLAHGQAAIKGAGGYFTTAGSGLRGFSREPPFATQDLSRMCMCFDRAIGGHT